MDQLRRDVGDVVRKAARDVGDAVRKAARDVQRVNAMPRLGEL